MSSNTDDFFATLMSLIEDDESNEKLADIQSQIITEKPKNKKLRKKRSSNLIVRNARDELEAPYEEIIGKYEKPCPESPVKPMTLEEAEKEWMQYFDFGSIKAEKLNESDLEDVDDVVKRMTEARLEEAVYTVNIKKHYDMRKKIFSLRKRQNEAFDLDILDALPKSELTKLEETVEELLAFIEDDLFSRDPVTGADADNEITRAISEGDLAIPEEIELKKKLIMDKLESLKQRLARVRAKHMAKHVSEEVGGLFEYGSRVVFPQKGGRHFQALSGSPSKKLQPLPTSVLKSFVGLIESTTERQKQLELEALKDREKTATSNSRVGRRKRDRINDGDEFWSPPVKFIKQEAKETDLLAGSVQHTMSSPRLQECDKVSRYLKDKFNDSRQDIDSDATMSVSSSEDELDLRVQSTPFDADKPMKPLAKRAISKCYHKQSQIASRLKWLQLNIYNLGDVADYLGNLLEDLRSKKDKVVSETEVNKANGDAELEGSARTRGYVKELHRKRKLLMLSNLHLTSKRAAQASNIVCQCIASFETCALCTGSKSGPRKPRPLADDLSLNQRIAAVDFGFHPILSFRKDIAASMILDDISARGDWQYKMLKTRPKGVARTVWKEYRKHSTVPLPRRRYMKKSERRAYQEALNAGSTSAAAAATAMAIADARSTASEIQKTAYMEFPAKYPGSLDQAVKIETTDSS